MTQLRSSPALDDISLTDMLYALADPTRLAIVASLFKAKRPLNCRDASPEGLPKSTLSHHYKVLRETGLILSERQGAEVFNTLRCDELNAKFPDVLNVIMNASKKNNI